MPSRSVLVINCGSSSIKFALFEEGSWRLRLSGLAERLGSPGAALHWQQAGERNSQVMAEADHRAALAELRRLLQESSIGSVHAIGHRVVHGGERFSAATRLDDGVLQAIRASTELAPLHNQANLLGIEAMLERFPQVPQVAVFDSAFHQSLPAHAYRYALPERLYREFGVRRYGFHGSSYKFVSRCAAELAGLPIADSSWLLAHLGNGCSTCAVVDGQSRDTSMGLTPLEGLVMGTRSGDVDPGLHGYLARTLGWGLEQVEHLLNHDSGLLGLSGLSSDMRCLEQAYQRGQAGARLAIEVFCYRLAKSLAAMSCALPRLDGLVFTGGIGENSPLIRQKTLDHLGLLGLALDPASNARTLGGQAGAIHAAGHPRVLVVPSDEARQIAEETLALLA